VQGHAGFTHSALAPQTRCNKACGLCLHASKQHAAILLLHHTKTLAHQPPANATDHRTYPVAGPYSNSLVQHTQHAGSIYPLLN
jgi:hypothetical protein